MPTKLEKQQKKWDPRLSIRLTPDQFTALQNALPWGPKNALFTEIVKWVVKTAEKKDGLGSLIKLAQGKATLSIKDKKP